MVTHHQPKSLGNFHPKELQVTVTSNPKITLTHKTS